MFYMGIGGHHIKKMRLIPIKKYNQADYYELYFVLDVHKMIQENRIDRFLWWCTLSVQLEGEI